MIRKADWIWADCEYSFNQYVDFYLDFDIDSPDAGAVLQISVDSEYAVWVNGIFINCGQYHDYPERKSYDTLSVGSALKAGKNRLEIGAYHQGGRSMQYKAGVNALCFALKNNDDVFLSGTDVMAAVNKRYTSGDTYKITAQLGYGYMYDAGQDKGEFAPAVVKKVNTTLTPRPIKKNVISDALPVSIIAQGYFIRRDKESKNIAHRMYTDFLSHRIFDSMFDGNSKLPGRVVLREMNYDGIYMIIDLGGEEGGFFTMDFLADSGALVEIGYGEHLDDLRVRTEIMSRQFANSYIAKGGGESFTYYFKRIAGRYIQLHVSGTSVFELRYAGILPCRYPITESSIFTCSDSLHNRIYDISRNTLIQCMHEHYEDCPWREQALYASDSRNQILCGYYMYEDYDFIRASLALLGDSFCEDGYQTICAPTDETLRIPSFTLLWFLEIAEYTEYTGDSYFVDNYWSRIENALKAYEASGFNPSEEEDYWNFYEWSDGYDNIRKRDGRENRRGFFDGMYKVFMCLGIKSLVSVAEKYGKEDFCRKYTDIYEKLKKDINTILWDESRQLYSSYYYDGERRHWGELMQVMAIFSGVAEGKEDILCETLARENNGLVGITLSYSLYKYEVLLARGGKYDKLVFDDIGCKWGNMLFSGADSFWETEGGADDFILAGSLCHGWSAFPIYLYHRYVMGITPSMLRGEGGSGRVVDVFASYEGRCRDILVSKKEGGLRDYIK